MVDMATHRPVDLLPTGDRHLRGTVAPHSSFNSAYLRITEQLEPYWGVRAPM